MAPTRTQYRLVQVIPIIPMGVTFIWTFFLPDSPRWLAAQDRHEDAKKSMAYYRCADQDSEIVAAEMDEMYGQLAKDHQTLYGVNTWTIVKECLKISSYRRRLILGLLFQTVAQWSGGNGITYYIGDVSRVSQSIRCNADKPLVDLQVRRHQQLRYSTRILRGLRSHETRLHHGLRLGTRRSHWSSALLPIGTYTSTHRPHLPNVLQPLLDRQK